MSSDMATVLRPTPVSAAMSPTMLQAACIRLAFSPMAVARDSRKSGSTGAPTDGCHFPLDVLAQVLHQMEAIGDLLGGWRAFPDALGIEPARMLPPLPRWIRPLTASARSLQRYLGLCTLGGVLTDFRRPLAGAVSSYFTAKNDAESQIALVALCDDN